ncbi:MAG TPA: hypothetical protein VD763_05340 [Candidatus Saccharimonadales bacterium]|nr:hypothetical protein [Candidatus Saccharimonadales bacterium]
MTEPTARPRVSRGLVFALVVVTCVLVPTVYAVMAANRGPARPGIGTAATPSLSVPSSGDPGASSGTSAEPSGSAVATPPGGPARLVFQHVARDADYAKVAVASLDEPNGPRTITGLTCERVHAAAGVGLCLVPEGSLVTRYWAIVFGSDFVERTRIELGGSPSRARVSADGRYGATTVFVYGHSYADAAFSTQTTIIDMASGTTIEELEQFSATRDGVAIHAPDFNYWGVTFAPDSNTFYATLRTGGRTYLVRGDIAARAVEVIHENVECPSLSPDGTRLGFKKLVGGPGEWRFTVLDLATLQETPLAETESIDDQLEWVDEDRLAYGKAGSLWSIASDGSGAPEPFVTDALSPAVVH